MINFLPSQKTKKWRTSYMGDFFGDIINAFNIDLFSARGKVRNGEKLYPHTLEDDIADLTPPSAFVSANINDGATTPRKIWGVADDKIIIRSLASTLPTFELDSSTGFDSAEDTNSGSDLLAVGDDSGEPIESTEVSISETSDDSAFAVTGSAGNTKWAQSFKAGGPLSSISYYVRKVGTPTGTYTISIQADSAGVPSGTPLVSITKDATVLSTAFVLKTEDIADFTPSSLQLDLSQTYWLVFERSASSTTNYLQFEMAVSSTDPYEDGLLKRYNGSTWSTAETASTTQTITDSFSSNGTWTCPAGVTSAIVECWAAGGGGSTNFGAGGGGAYSMKTVTVVPTTGYAIVVGTSAANTNGGDSTFATTTVVAKGGLSGTNGGTGGAAGSGTGDTKFSGGNGSIGTGDRGGGGGAGSTTAGGNGFNELMGLGGDLEGGQGGGILNGLTYNAGRIYGGGGNSTAAAQQTGARGEVRVTYTTTKTADYPNVTGRVYKRGTATTMSVVPPLDTIPGELLLLVLSANGNATVTIPGYTLLDSLNDATNVVSQHIFYRRASGDDRATVTSDYAEGGMSYVLYRLESAGTPTTTQATGSGSNANPPNHDTGTLANYLWIAAGSWDSSANINISAAPSGYGSFVLEPSSMPDDGDGANSGDPHTAVSDKQASASSDNPGTFTSGSEQWVAATIAVPFDDTPYFADAAISISVEFPAEDERLYLTTTTDVKFLGEEDTVWQSLWQGICQQDPLDENFPHPMKNLGAGGVLFVGDGNLLHSVLATAVGPGDAQNSRVVFAQEYFINWLVVTKSAVFIGLQNKESDLLPSFVAYYEPTSELVRMFEMPEGATVGYAKNENCEVIDKSGQIRIFTGSDFRPYDYLPSYYYDQAVTTLPHRNAFVVKDGIVRFLWEGEYPSYAGIWTQENDRLYHRNSLVFDRDNLNSFGALEGAGDWRALYWTGLDYVMGASVKDDSLATIQGVFSDKNISGTPVSTSTRGNFLTPKFGSQGINNNWHRLFAKLDERRDGIQSGEINMKYRKIGNPIGEGIFADAFTGTWTSATTFTSSTTQFKTDVDAGNIVAGNEIIVRTGNGAGLLAHIVSIAGAVAATKTVTIDEGMAAVTSGSMTFSVENWTKTENKKMIGGMPTEWLQVKTEIRDNIDLDELQVGSTPNQNADER